MEYTIFDKETDGLLDTVTVIRCISYSDFKDGVLIGKGSITSYDEMRNFYSTRKIIIGHNIKRFDLPVAEKILGITYQGNAIDTLAISWYMFPIKGWKHGLEAWGERLGFKKPEIGKDEWKGPLEGETQEQFLAKMINRCEGDVEINIRLFHEQIDYLKELYSHGGDLKALFSYLGFKMECLYDQEIEGIPLDIELCENSRDEVQRLVNEKVSLLEKVMPPVLDKAAPKKMYKKDGLLSKLGEKWMDLIDELCLPEGTLEIYALGNPGSDTQLKAWLFSLGWEPITFKLSSATGKNLPQVSLPFGGGICPSIQEMYEEHPVLEELENLYMLRHRAGLFKSFLEAVDNNGKVYASAAGFTNTLRLKHRKPIANLPKVEKPWGKEIRGAFKIPNENFVMCGSDISGLEDNTKQHYIFFYDPEYVMEMRVPGFDPHIDIGVLANMITKEEEDLFKFIEANIEKDRDYLKTADPEKVAHYKAIKKIRGSAKTVNFSATYGAGAPKIATTLKCDLPFAQKLHTTYWNRNAAVKKTAKAAKVVTIRGQKWLYNPVSGFWMFLKAEKDRFSTLNQSTGVYVFDSWLRKVREKLKSYNIKVLLQYHDEIMLIFPKGYESIIEAILRQSMQEVNQQIKLNVEIGISVDFGINYGAVH